MSTTTQVYDGLQTHILIEADLGTSINPYELSQTVEAFFDIIRVQFAYRELTQFSSRIVKFGTSTTNVPLLMNYCRDQVLNFGLSGMFDPDEISSMISPISWGGQRSTQNAIDQRLSQIEPVCEHLLLSSNRHLNIERFTYRNPLEILIVVGGIAAAARAAEWVVRKRQEIKQRTHNDEKTQLENRLLELDIAGRELDLTNRKNRVAIIENRRRESSLRQLTKNSGGTNKLCTEEYIVRAGMTDAVGQQVSPNSLFVRRGTNGLEQIPDDASLRLF